VDGELYVLGGLAMATVQAQREIGEEPGYGAQVQAKIEGFTMQGVQITELSARSQTKVREMSRPISTHTRAEVRSASTTFCVAEK
jgi:hypothetical protein